MEATFEPPGPGPWQQDSAHLPRGFSPLIAELYPRNAQKGFTETFARWGLLLDTLAWGIVNGYAYHQPQPFDMPGPDGPMTPEQIGAEFERRAGVAAGVFENKIWRDVLAQWDNELKPASIARHRELGDVDLASLDDSALRAHVEECLEHVENMAYQHHRFNATALGPVGDFVLHAAEWLHEPPTSLFGVYDGYSTASSVVSPELEPALEALKGDDDARALLSSQGEAQAVLDELRQRVAAVDDFVRSTGFRLVDGFDITCKTAAECPEIILGRLAAGLDTDTSLATQRADKLSDSMRERIAPEHVEMFDDLLTESRLVYRLRDERGLYSDISAFGILRWAMLELGDRLQKSHRIDKRDHIFEVDLTTLRALMAGASSPNASEIAEAAERRRAIVEQGAPRYLGPPPPDPPPLDQLPPPLARVMGAIGFSIEGVLGELDEPQGDDTLVIGIPGNPGIYEGRVHLVSSIDDLLTMEQGDVLVAESTGEAFNTMLHLVGAIVTDHGSFACHAAIVARECGFPAVVGCTNATSRLKEGQRVQVDGASGEVTVLA